MSAGFKTDWEIAQAARLKPIQAIADGLDIPADAVEPYGRHKAKIDMGFIAERLASGVDGRLILVTAINPTPAGEGKTTTTVGLGDALNRIGRKTIICLREPSLGPCFGAKGGAAGGGLAQVVPMEDLNLHFTGDFHAIGAANNLLAAMLDNHIYWGNALNIDPRRITWRRCVDINDRALRAIALSSGGAASETRDDGFDITVASEVMAILCLATSVEDLERRLAKIVVAFDREGAPVLASQLKADKAMAALLADAIKPNLVQTLENNPVIVHGGPFANIAHGCNSVLATRLALKLGDFVVTEAGFGADLGAEKFFNIKCRKAGLTPDMAVIVATVRALKFHGGVGTSALRDENVEAVARGAANLIRHIENLAKFGVPSVVAINQFERDTDAETEQIVKACAALGVQAVICRHWAEGGAGAVDLARAVVEVAERPREAPFRLLYPDDMPLMSKIETIAHEIYRAQDVALSKVASDQLAALQVMGFGNLPVCIAKTQYSNSSDPTLLGAPTGHTLHVREVRLSAGAEFVVAVCGRIFTMPGLPRVPSAETIGLDINGRIVGLC